MARYIDADKVLDKMMFEMAGTGHQARAMAVIRYAETADVVPKSEVDRLVDKWIGEENLTQDAMVLRLIEALRDEAKRYEKYYFNHEYDKLIADAKQEVAREIFEEIERTLPNEFPFLGTAVAVYLAELKNKYTESEGKK